VFSSPAFSIPFSVAPFSWPPLSSADVLRTEWQSLSTTQNVTTWSLPDYGGCYRFDAAALGPFKKYDHGQGQEKEISLFGTISGKSLKLLPPDVIF